MQHTFSYPGLPSSLPVVHLEDLYHTQQLAIQQARYHTLAMKAAAFPTDPSFSRDTSLHFFSVPGRTELGGNHTDHNHGRVLAASIDADMAAAVRFRTDKVVRLASDGFPVLEMDLADLHPRKEECGSSAAIIRGIAAWCAAHGMKVCGFDAAVHSNVPPGSGLSSSAAFEVLIGAILAESANTTLDPLTLALAGQYAEHVYFGKPCGLMDQIACGIGGIVAIDFGNPAAPAIERLEYDFLQTGYHLVLLHTGSSHADLNDCYASIPQEMKAVAACLGTETLAETDWMRFLSSISELRTSCGDRAILRALHFMHETRRPLQMRQALEQGDIGRYLSLVRESGSSSWRLLQNVHTCDSREQSVALALALTEQELAGRGACRVHGGGFAGSIQVYLPLDMTEQYIASMERVFGKGCVQTLALRGTGACR
ncbi:MAG: galactokinase family protein, partial [Spirochaetales bacterium]|nr:galactokinase family protein [Spirochaetales bacterium]